MNEYLLTARLDGTTSRYTFSAKNDNDAIFEASFEVMNRASDHGSGSRVNWAYGEIRLTRKDTGEVIKTMDAKPVNA